MKKSRQTDKLFRKLAIQPSHKIDSTFVDDVSNIKYCAIVLFSYVSTWQSATLLTISCKLISPVPAWVEEPR